MEIDRISIRSRPSGEPIMMQRWDMLLFMHWEVPAATLRPLIPDALEIDTYNGSAWIGVTPFTMPSVRPRGTPPPPLIGSTHEINVRTYVHHDGVPGVWFFSLDASNPLAVAGARAGFGLPYYFARMEMEEHQRTVRFLSRRMHPGAPAAQFEASWRREEALPQADPESHTFFLTERYCLYSLHGERVRRCRIHHDPWPLCEVALDSYTSTMVESHGITLSGAEPLLHGQIAPLEVAIWAPETV